MWDLHLISRAPCAKKARSNTDPRRVYARTFICVCAFVILILILLYHCSILDSPISSHAQASPSTSHVNPAFNHKAPSVSLSRVADGAAPIGIRSMYSQKPLAAFLPSARLRMLHAQKSSLPVTNMDVKGASNISASSTPALQGLGTLFIRGTIAVSELVVAHVEEGTSIAEFRMFLKTFHRSGMSARSDVVFIFASDALLAAMEHVILQEHTHLCKLLSQYKQSMAPFNEALNTTVHSDKIKVSNSTISPFQYNTFGSPSVHDMPIWGHDPVGFVNSSKQRELGDGPFEFGFGSIIGFLMSDINPDNILEGFIDNPPLELRRWPCYQMLLGMVKHEFKQVLLTGVKRVLILGDPLAMARRKAGLFFSLTDIHWGSTSTLTIENGNEGKHVMYEDTKVCAPGASQNIEESVRTTHTMLILPHAPLHRDSNDGYKEPLKQFKKQDRMHTMPKHRKKYMQRTVNQHMKTRRETRQAGVAGLYERVYGSTMWNMLESEGKCRRLVNSAAMIGDMRSVRGIVNAMVTEIVKVALQRESRQAFPDNVLLSHIVHNRNEGVLGKKVLEHLHLLDNSVSFVHASTGLCQPSVQILRKRNQQVFSMISGSQAGSSRIWNHVVDLIHKDICLSSVDARIYNDCLH